MLSVINRTGPHNVHTVVEKVTLCIDRLFLQLVLSIRSLMDLSNANRDHCNPTSYLASLDYDQSDCDCALLSNRERVSWKGMVAGICSSEK